MGKLHDKLWKGSLVKKLGTIAGSTILAAGLTLGGVQTYERNFHTLDKSRFERAMDVKNFKRADKAKLSMEAREKVLSHAVWSVGGLISPPQEAESLQKDLETIRPEKTLPAVREYILETDEALSSAHFPLENAKSFAPMDIQRLEVRAAKGRSDLEGVLESFDYLNNHDRAKLVRKELLPLVQYANAVLAIENAARVVEEDPAEAWNILSTYKKDINASLRPTGGEFDEVVFRHSPEQQERLVRTAIMAYDALTKEFVKRLEEKKDADDLAGLNREKDTSKAIDEMYSTYSSIEDYHTTLLDLFVMDTGDDFVSLVPKTSASSYEGYDNARQIIVDSLHDAGKQVCKEVEVLNRKKAVAEDDEKDQYKKIQEAHQKEISRLFKEALTLYEFVNPLTQKQIRSAGLLEGYAACNRAVIEGAAQKVKKNLQAGLSELTNYESRVRNNPGYFSRDRSSKEKKIIEKISEFYQKSETQMDLLKKTDRDLYAELDLEFRLLQEVWAKKTFMELHLGAIEDLPEALRRGDERKRARIGTKYNKFVDLNRSVINQYIIELPAGLVSKSEGTKYAFSDADLRDIKARLDQTKVVPELALINSTLRDLEIIAGQYEKKGKEYQDITGYADAGLELLMSLEDHIRAYTTDKNSDPEIVRKIELDVGTLHERILVRGIKFELKRGKEKMLSFVTGYPNGNLQSTKHLDDEDRNHAKRHAKNSLDLAISYVNKLQAINPELAGTYAQQIEDCNGQDAFIPLYKALRAHHTAQMSFEVDESSSPSDMLDNKSNADRSFRSMETALQNAPSSHELYTQAKDRAKDIRRDYLTNLKLSAEKLAAHMDKDTMDVCTVYNRVVVLSKQLDELEGGKESYATQGALENLATFCHQDTE